MKRIPVTSCLLPVLAYSLCSALAEGINIQIEGKATENRVGSFSERKLNYPHCSKYRSEE